MANPVNSTRAGSIRSESPAIETAEPASLTILTTSAHEGISGLLTEMHEEGGQYLLRKSKFPDTEILYLVRHFRGLSFVLLIESYSSVPEKWAAIKKDKTMKQLDEVFMVGVNDDSKIVVPVI